MDRARSGDERSRFERRHGDERLTIRNSDAYVLDPRLLTLSLGGTFGLTQDWLNTDRTRSFDQGRLYGYDAVASVLEDEPLSLDVFANRDQATVARELAGESDLLTENRGATLSARRLPIPSALTFRQEHEAEASSIAGVTARRAEHRNIVRYEGQRGWVNQDVDATYEFTDDVDEVFPDLSFENHEGELDYGLDFGEELNRHWDSRFHVTSRTGLTRATIATANESLHVDHSSDLRSDYRYSFLRTVMPGGATTSHDVFASVQHQLWGSLTTTAGAGGSHQTLLPGDKETALGRVDVLYSKQLPHDGRLTLSPGASLQYEDERFRASATQVFQESHTAATPIASPMALANRFVVISSIVVTKTATGPLPVGCLPPPGPPTPLVLGRDYTARTSGDLTEIVPIPCAGAVPGINPGDTIAVDYQFTVAPALSFMTKSWHAGLSVDYPWIRVFVEHERSTQDLLSGRDSSFLNDEESTGVGAELRWNASRFHASATGEARRYTSTRVRSDTLRAGAHADLSILAGLVLSVDADQTITEFPDQRRETVGRTTRAGVSYVLGSFVFLNATGGMRSLSDTEEPTEETAEARLTARLQFRKLEFGPELGYFSRRRGESTTTEYRALLTTIRRF